MNEIVILKKEELVTIMKLALISFEKEKDNEFPKLYSINQVSKKLHRSFATIKKHAQSGLLRTTKSGLITEAAINEYLNRNI